jgi:hypothetical protein
MINPFTSHSIPVEFYDVVLGADGIEKQYDYDNDCNVVFLMDHFGFIDAETHRICEHEKAKGKIVVYDATHSFFCYNMQYSVYNYVFGSFRKWLGVNAGFCAKQGHWLNFPILRKNKTYTEERNNCFELKSAFMNDESVDKKSFLNGFSHAEDYLGTDYYKYGPDDQSLQTMARLNVDYLRKCRRTNAEFLITALATEGVVSSMFSKVGLNDCPLFVPLKIMPEKRAEFRRSLIGNDCYLPIHWPESELHQLNNKSRVLYEREISCICDQRYGNAEMNHLIELIIKG